MSTEPDPTVTRCYRCNVDFDEMEVMRHKCPGPCADTLCDRCLRSEVPGVDGKFCKRCAWDIPRVSDAVCDLVSVSNDCTVRTWDSTRQVRLGKMDKMTVHADSVNCIAVAPDGSGRVATGSLDKTVSISSTDYKMPMKIQVGSGVNSVAWLPGGDKLVAGCDDKNLHVFDVSSGNKIATLEGHTSYVISVAVSNNGLWIASGAGDGCSLRIWSAVAPYSPLCVQEHPDTLKAVAFFPDSSRVVTGCADSHARVFSIAADGKSLEEVMSLRHAEPVDAVFVSPDSRTIATGANYDNSVFLWNATDGSKLHELKGHTMGVCTMSLSFSADGGHLCSGSQDMSIRVWNVSSGKEVAVLEGHRNSVLGVAFVPAPSAASSSLPSSKPLSKAAAVAQQ